MILKSKTIWRAAVIALVFAVFGVFSAIGVSAVSTFTPVLDLTNETVTVGTNNAYQIGSGTATPFLAGPLDVSGLLTGNEQTLTLSGGNGVTLTLPARRTAPIITFSSGANGNQDLIVLATPIEGLEGNLQARGLNSSWTAGAQSIDVSRLVNAPGNLPLEVRLAPITIGPEAGRMVASSVVTTPEASTSPELPHIVIPDRPVAPTTALRTATADINVTGLTEAGDVVVEFRVAGEGATWATVTAGDGDEEIAITRADFLRSLEDFEEGAVEVRLAATATAPHSHPSSQTVAAVPGAPTVNIDFVAETATVVLPTDVNADQFAMRIPGEQNGNFVAFEVSEDNPVVQLGARVPAYGGQPLTISIHRIAGGGQPTSVAREIVLQPRTAAPDTTGISWGICDETGDEVLVFASPAPAAATLQVSREANVWIAPPAHINDWPAEAVDMSVRTAGVAPVGETPGRFASMANSAPVVIPERGAALNPVPAQGTVADANNIISVSDAMEWRRDGFEDGEWQPIAANPLTWAQLGEPDAAVAVQIRRAAPQNLTTRASAIVDVTFTPAVVNAPTDLAINFDTEVITNANTAHEWSLTDDADDWNEITATDLRGGHLIIDDTWMGRLADGNNLFIRTAAGAAPASAAWGVRVNARPAVSATYNFATDSFTIPENALWSWGNLTMVAATESSGGFTPAETTRVVSLAGAQVANTFRVQLPALPLPSPTEFASAIVTIDVPARNAAPTLAYDAANDRLTVTGVVPANAVVELSVDNGNSWLGTTYQTTAAEGIAHLTIPETVTLRNAQVMARVVLHVGAHLDDPEHDDHVPARRASNNSNVVTVPGAPAAGPNDITINHTTERLVVPAVDGRRAMEVRVVYTGDNTVLVAPTALPAAGISISDWITHAGANVQLQVSFAAVTGSNPLPASTWVNVTNFTARPSEPQIWDGENPENPGAGNIRHNTATNEVLGVAATLDYRVGTTGDNWNEITGTALSLNDITGSQLTFRVRATPNTFASEASAPLALEARRAAPRSVRFDRATLTLSGLVGTAYGHEGMEIIATGLNAEDEEITGTIRVQNAATTFDLATFDNNGVTRANMVSVVVRWAGSAEVAASYPTTPFIVPAAPVDPGQAEEGTVAYLLNNVVVNLTTETITGLAEGMEISYEATGENWTRVGAAHAANGINIANRIGSETLTIRVRARADADSDASVPVTFVIAARPTLTPATHAFDGRLGADGELAATNGMQWRRRATDAWATSTGNISPAVTEQGTGAVNITIRRAPADGVVVDGDMVLNNTERSGTPASAPLSTSIPRSPNAPRASYRRGVIAIPEGTVWTVTAGGEGGWDARPASGNLEADTHFWYGFTDAVYVRVAGTETTRPSAFVRVPIPN